MHIYLQDGTLLTQEHKKYKKIVKRAEYLLKYAVLESVGVTLRVITLHGHLVVEMLQQTDDSTWVWQCFVDNPKITFRDLLCYFESTGCVGDLHLDVGNIGVIMEADNNNYSSLQDFYVTLYHGERMDASSKRLSKLFSNYVSDMDINSTDYDEVHLELLSGVVDKLLLKEDYYWHCIIGKYSW